MMLRASEAKSGTFPCARTCSNIRHYSLETIAVEREIVQVFLATHTTRRRVLCHESVTCGVSCCIYRLLRVHVMVYQTTSGDQCTYCTQLLTYRLRTGFSCVLLILMARYMKLSSL